MRFQPDITEQSLEEKQTKICFFNTHKSWGGGEKWHFDTASRLSESGFPVLVATNINSELSRKARQAGLPTANFSLGNISFLNPFKMWRLLKFFQNQKVSRIILNLPADLKSAGIAARLAGIERIIYRRGSAIPVKDTFFNRFLFRRIITGVIANSEETKETLLNNNRNLIPVRRIHVIYNGIDLEAWDRQPTESLSFRKDSSIVLGHAGRLCRQKNQKFLIEVAGKLKSKDVPFHLVIAGEGEMREELEAYARDQGLDKHVEFLGFCHDMKSFMGNIDVFLLSSIWEGFGYVLVEAMACQKPVVAFDSSSTPEVVVNGLNGYLTPPQDLDAYVEAIVKIVSNHDLQQTFGAAGRKRVEEHFEIEKNLGKLKNVLGLKDSGGG